MGILPWDLDGGFSSPPRVRTPRLTVRCEYPDSGMVTTEVSFSVSPRYGIHTAHAAHAWFLGMMREHEEFEVETDRARQSGV